MSTNATITTSHDYPVFEYTPPMRPTPPLLMMERSTTIKWNPKANIEVAPNCPRCASTNTKFCYYNNYSVSQPRYFCKACRRYWTKGGSLRNVPIGGGCRKSRRARPARHEGDTTHPRTHTTIGSGITGPTNIESENNTNIELVGTIFPKYVEQNVENNYTTSDHNIHASSMPDIDKPVDLINGGDDGLQPQQVGEFIDGQDFEYQNYNAFEMEGEVEGDMLWAEGINLPSLSAQQPALQMQDFEIFATDDDDQLRISANWGSFDLSGFEIFTRN